MSIGPCSLFFVCLYYAFSLNSDLRKTFCFLNSLFQYIEYFYKIRKMYILKKTTYFNAQIFLCPLKSVL